MATKNFEEYAATRLTKEERAEIKQEALREAYMLLAVQNFIASSIEEYMVQNNVDDEQLAQQLGVQLSRLKKMKKGQVNMRIYDFIHLMTALGKDLEFK